jgi:hypothetical protein
MGVNNEREFLAVALTAINFVAFSACGTRAAAYGFRNQAALRTFVLIHSAATHLICFQQIAVSSQAVETGLL